MVLLSVNMDEKWWGVAWVSSFRAQDSRQQDPREDLGVAELV